MDFFNYELYVMIYEPRRVIPVVIIPEKKGKEEKLLLHILDCIEQMYKVIFMCCFKNYDF